MNQTKHSYPMQKDNIYFIVEVERIHSKLNKIKASF